VSAAAIRHEPALRFWLRYAEREGALVEDAGDHALALLPDALREATELPEEVSVTSDPDVAREDGAVLLIPGHPALDRAASAVLADGDAGLLYLPWPGSRRPSRATLEARARELVAVAHGRIDAAGEVVAAYLPLLRVGAMVSYAASLTLRFQEQEEAWVDARSGLDVATSVLDAFACGPRLRALRGERFAFTPRGDARRRSLPADLPLALRGAHEQLERRARVRRDVLAMQARRAAESELARADAYYGGALDSIERRRASAPAGRLRLLEAQADATRVEHSRRRREIEDEFHARYELHPFRLHLVHVPAYVLAVDVLRGSRRSPFELVWIAGAGEFAAIRCPACGAAEELVAGRERLGCAACTPGAAPRSAQAAPAPEAKRRRPAGASPPPASRVEEPGRRRQAGAPQAKGGTAERAARPRSARPEQPQRVAGRGSRAAMRSGRGTGASKDTPRKIERTGNKLALAFWQAVAGGERWPRKKVARHSPLAALYRLYGQVAPVCALGIPPKQWPSEVTASTYPTRSGVPELTIGDLLVAESSYTYALYWWLEAGRPVVAEVMPAPHPLVLKPARHGSVETEARLQEWAPVPANELDPVATALRETELADAGLPFAARCLATWWRLRDTAVPGEPPAAVAAAVAVSVARAAGMRRARADAAARYGTTAAAVDRVTRALGGGLRLDRARGW
jgi:hypothetical protein